MQNPTATTSTPTNIAPIVAVAESIDGVTGTMGFWRLSGEVDCDTLRDAATAAGLDAAILPKNPSVERALKRTAVSFAPGSHNKVHRHPKGGYCIVHRGESEDGEHLEFTEGLRIWWEGTKTEGALRISNPSDPRCDAIRGRFEHFRVTFVSEDISLWLPTLMARLDATSLRPGGGFYFVPASTVPQWDAWAEVFRACSGHKLYSDIPAMQTEGMLEAVLDAIVEEAKATVAKQGKKLDDTGKRGLKSKEVALEALTEKVMRYEEIIGRKLPEIHSQTNALKGKVAQNLLTADED